MEKSLIEEGSEKKIKEIYDKAINLGCEIFIPSDVAVSENIQGKPNFKDLDKIEGSERILDVSY